MDITNIFIDTIARETLIKSHDRILLAVSAGTDSTCLFHLINRIAKDYSLSIGLAHVNYSLRPLQSDEDESFLRALAKDYELELFVKKASIKGKSNIQAIARDIRYSFFKEVMDGRGYKVLALGHNADDLLENFFLRLCKGSLLKGLVSLSYKSNSLGLPIIRPLLDIPKSSIIEYLKDNKYSYRQDESNFETKYKRNALRLKVLPLLEEEFPMYRKTIRKTIDHLKDDYRYIKSEVAYTLRKLTTKLDARELSLDINLFRGLKEGARKKVIIEALSLMMQGLSFSKKHIDELDRKILSFDGAGTICLFRRGNFHISLIYNRISFHSKDDLLEASVFNELPMSLFAGKSYKLSSSYFLHIKLFKLSPLRCRLLKDLIKRKGSSLILFKKQEGMDLCIRRIRRGDRISFNSVLRQKSISDLLIDKKVPRDIRSNTLIFLDGLKLIGYLVPFFGLARISESYYIDTLDKEALAVIIRHI